MKLMDRYNLMKSDLLRFGDIPPDTRKLISHNKINEAVKLIKRQIEKNKSTLNYQEQVLKILKEGA